MSRVHIVIALFGLLVARTPVRADAVITNAAALFALDDGEVARGRTFALTGQLIYYRHPNFILDDGTGRIPILLDGQPVRPEVGDRVQVSSGTCRLNTTGTRVFQSSVYRVIGKAPPPPPRDVSVTDLEKPACAFAHVRVRGRVHEMFTDELEPRCLYLTLVPETARDAPFVLCTTFADTPAPLQEGAVVRISGLYIPWVTSLRRYGGPILSFEKQALEVISTPDRDSDAPDFSSHAFVSPDKILALGKRRLDGTVLATWEGNQLLVRSADGKVHRVELALGQSLPGCSDEVTLVGNAETDLYHLNLSHAVCRIRRRAAAPPGAAAPLVMPEEILGNAQRERQINPGFSGQLIRIRGRLTLPQSIVCDYGHLYLNCGQHIVPVDVSALGGNRPEIPLNSVVEAVGICLLDIDNWRPSSAFPKIRGFAVITRTPDDIRVIASPPWWTPLKLVTLTVLLTAAFLAYLVLSRQIARATTTLKVNERTRLAVELHDSLSQNLAGVACQLEALRCALSAAPASVPARVLTIKRMLLSCRTELKRDLFDLRSNTLEERNLDQAIRTTLRPLLGTARLAVRIDVPRLRLSDMATHTILCIIRELVSNAVRHGRATQIDVEGDLADGTLTFSVADNGIGFDPQDVAGPFKGHFGLQGVHDRLDRLSGALSIRSSPGSGTRATFVLRLDNLNRNRTAS